MEPHPHTRNHRYSLCDSIGPTLMDEGPNSWGAQEDLQLLTSLMNAHLNQWPELSKDWERRGHYARQWTGWTGHSFEVKLVNMC